MSEAEAPRQGLGTFFSALLEFVDGRGLREQVRARVSPATRALIDTPPRSLSFVASTPVDEIETALGDLAGAGALADCGLEMARRLSGTIIRPVLRTTFLLFGQDPGSVFNNLDRFFSLVTRGIHFSFDRGEEAKAGVISARFEGPGTPLAAMHVLRGTLQFVFELTAANGDVSVPEVVSETPAGSLVRYRVRWQ